MIGKTLEDRFNDRMTQNPYLAQIVLFTWPNRPCLERQIEGIFRILDSHFTQGTRDVLSIDACVSWRSDRTMSNGSIYRRANIL
jgi:hypothetical protein